MIELSVLRSERQVPIRQPKELWNILDARLRQFRERNQHYEEMLTYYFGRQKRGQRPLHEVLGSTSTGRPLLRDVGMALDVSRRYVSNRLAPIVEDYQALIGRLPSVRVEPPGAGQAAVEKAEKQTRYLLNTYDRVSMNHHQAYAGFTLSCLGDAVYVLEVDSETDRVLPAALLPIWCYPAFRRGPLRYDLYDLLVAYTWEADEIEREFGISPRSDDPYDRTVLVYMSPHQRTVVVGSREYSRTPHHVQWDLGFCPAVWLRNKVTGALGGSDIAPVLGLQNMYDFTLNVMADGLVEMTYPMRVIKGAVSRADGPMQIGPGATVEVGPDGDAKAVALAPPPQAGQMMAQMVLEDMNISTGTSSVRQTGMPDRSNISGRALHAAQGPQATRIELKQILLGEGLIKLNSAMMAMQEKAPLVGDKTLEIYGKYRGSAFKEDFVPSQDIDGWYLNTATWDELVGVNRQQRIQMAVELVQANLADSVYAMELAGIEDPVKMQKAIEDDKKRLARLQGELAQEQQASAAPGPGAGAPPVAGGGSNSPSPGPPPPQFRPPELAGTNQGAGAAALALPTGAPKGITRETVQKALEGVELHGQVFAVGDLATEEAAQRVTLRISDSRDYQAVRAAVLHFDPKPEIRYQREDNMPPEKVKVA